MARLDNITTYVFKMVNGELTKTTGTFSTKGVFTPITPAYPDSSDISKRAQRAILNRVVIQEWAWNIYSGLGKIPYSVEKGSYSVSGVPYKILKQTPRSQKITYTLPKRFVIGSVINPRVKATSRLVVKISSTNTKVARIKKGRVEIVGKGKATLVFTQKGSAGFKRAVTKVKIVVKK